MAGSLFTIFGDYLTHKPNKNVTRQPLSNTENMGKTISSGPYKPNEPTKKKSEQKKSFLSNLGKALPSTTPAWQVFSPRAVNFGPMIYSDDDFMVEDVEFTEPKNNNDNYMQLFEYLQPKSKAATSPPKIPPYKSYRDSMEFEDSYEDEFFTDEIFNGSFNDVDDDLGLPSLY